MDGIVGSVTSSCSPPDPPGAGEKPLPPGDGEKPSPPFGDGEKPSPPGDGEKPLAILGEGEKPFPPGAGVNRLPPCDGDGESPSPVGTVGNSGTDSSTGSSGQQYSSEGLPKNVDTIFSPTNLQSSISFDRFTHIGSTSGFVACTGEGVRGVGEGPPPVPLPQGNTGTGTTTGITTMAGLSGPVPESEGLWGSI